MEVNYSLENKLGKQLAEQTVVATNRNMRGFRPIVAKIALVRGNFVRRGDLERGWRLGHEGRDQMFYEEIVSLLYKLHNIYPLF